MYKSTAQPPAVAYVRGGENAPNLYGDVKFYQKREGVLVVANVFNLPKTNASGFFALHIHEGNTCAGENFSDTGNHYNPEEAPHPNHAGDLPPLLMYNGGAYLAVMTDRFIVDEIVGRTVVIHGGPDDFVSQPSGNAGTKIACGIIKRI